MKLQNLSYVDAVKTLLANTFSFETLEQAQEVRPAHEPKKEVIIESVKPLQNSSLIKYVERRKINIEIAKQYLQEIYYKNTPTQEKSYFGVCMQNESKGYAVRNSYNKYCLINSNYTFIDNGFSDTVSIFEGMFDFLAFLTYYDKPIKSNVIILHSVTNVSKVINHFPKDAKQVFLFLDNDKAGQTATNELTQHFNNFALVKDKRNIFAGYKDFGDYVSKPE
jgi:AAA+ ATPase superfamily predicted ATPase